MKALAIACLLLLGAAAVSAKNANAPGQQKKADPLAQAQAEVGKLTGQLRAEEARSKKCGTDLAGCTKKKDCSAVAQNLARCNSALDAANANAATLQATIDAQKADLEAKDAQIAQLTADLAAAQDATATCEADAATAAQTCQATTQQLTADVAAAQQAQQSAEAATQACLADKAAVCGGDTSSCTARRLARLF